ncbi:MAG: thioredoxin domain-containing protein [Hyphomicrobiaceae bacterium]
MFRFERGTTLFTLLLLLLLSVQASAAPLVNQLADHPSPYLALHGHDPVAWQEWNAATIARARRESKLLYVSVGYFACRWCHVMQRESYQNPQIAALLNRDFIPVKVDRELNTGLDDALQVFSARLRSAAGWPLNAFVTPQGYPAYVVLYEPPDAFRALLTQLSARWAADSAGIRRLAMLAAPPAGAPPTDAPLTATRSAKAWDRLIASVWQEADTLRGGFGQVSKFPMAPQLSALLDRQTRQPDARLAGFLRLTFNQMATRGMRDHVGGGFFRYTVDPDWDAPHFEKMLYDNAQLAILYLRAAAVLDQPGYREVVRSTLGFMRDELQDASGGFYSSTSAVDASGREGPPTCGNALN